MHSSPEIHGMVILINDKIWNIFSSVQSLSHVWLFAAHGLQHAKLPCPSPTPRVYPNSCPLSLWCHSTISSCVIPSPPTFNLSQNQDLSQSVSSLHQVAKVIGVSASASVLPKNIQDRFPLGWTDWSSLQSKRLSRVFFNTTVQKHQFFSTQLSLLSNSHIHAWLLEKL